MSRAEALRSLPCTIDVCSSSYCNCTASRSICPVRRAQKPECRDEMERMRVRSEVSRSAACARVWRLTGHERCDPRAPDRCVRCSTRSMCDVSAGVSTVCRIVASVRARGVTWTIAWRGGRARAAWARGFTSSLRWYRGRRRGINQTVQTDDDRTDDDGSSLLLFARTLYIPI